VSADAGKKILITGAYGFVGLHLVAQLRSRYGQGLALCLTSKSAETHPVLGGFKALDVTDEAEVSNAIARFSPTHVIHLAGLAAIPMAAANANLAWQVHLNGTLNVANAILSHAPGCTLLNVGSGQVYGESARKGLLLDENALLAPGNGYEVTKAAADLAVGALARQGLHGIRLRPFNHTGPGQTEDFVLPSFAMQIARIEAGLQQPVVHVGNLDAERDFLDVRDVTNAYVLAVEKSAELPPGVVLNIASGSPRRIRDLLDHLVGLARVPIKVELDPTRMRPSDTPRFVGEARLAHRLLGWSPQYTIETTLADVLSDCRERVAASQNR
jgi:GDP-4-dehydro-6-deoxy-D-mannose reductase